MKVSLVSLSNSNRVTSSTKVHQKNDSAASSLTSCPYQNDKTQVPYNYIISSLPNFKGYYKINLHSLKFQDMPCPCCGSTMIPAKEFMRIFIENKGNIPIKAKEVVEFLEPYKDKLHKIERACFNIIENVSKKNPDKNVQQILNELQKDSLQKLNISQFTVFNRIENLCKGLPKNEINDLKKYLKEARITVTNKNGKVTTSFKRKDFIKNIQKYSEKISYARIREEINEASLDLSSSRNDLNAFIVKYSKREPQETITRLVSSASSTIEHIIPKSPIEGENGTDSMKNLILECKDCNNEKGNIPLNEWIKEHPEMIVNVQNYFNYLIEIVNKGGLEDYSIEIPKVAKTLEEESNGKIKIDLSRLKIPVLV